MALNFDQLTATTYKNYRKTLADNVTKKIMLLAALKKAGRVERKKGGIKLVEPLMYGLNSTFKTYAGYDVLDNTPQDGITAAEYDWRDAAVGITISKQELDINAGAPKIIDLMQAKVDQAEKTFELNMNKMLFGSAAAVTKDFQGLGNFVTAAGGTSVGGIDPATYAWWANKVGTAATFSTNGLGAMRKLFNDCSRNGDQPKYIITDQTTFEAYEAMLPPLERIQYNKGDELAGDIGFQTLLFKGLPIGWDYHCTAKTMFFLNFDYLKFVIDSDTDFTMTKWREPVNQMAKTAYILLRGQLVCSNRQLQGRLTVINY